MKKKLFGSIMVLALSLLFCMNVFADAALSAEDYVVSDYPFSSGSESNWTSSQTDGSDDFVFGNNSSAEEGDTDDASVTYYYEFTPGSNTTAYLYYSTETTFPAGTYTITYNASGMDATIYPYLSEQIASFSSSSTSTSLTFSIDEETTGYMGIYVETNASTDGDESTSIKFTGISIQYVSEYSYSQQTYDDTATKTDTLTYYYNIQAITDLDTTFSVGDTIYLVYPSSRSGSVTVTEDPTFYSFNEYLWTQEVLGDGLTAGYLQITQAFNSSSTVPASQYVYSTSGYYVCEATSGFDNCKGYLFFKNGAWYYSCRGGAFKSMSVVIYTIDTLTFSASDVTVENDEDGNPIVKVTTDEGTITLDSSICHFSQSGSTTVLTLGDTNEDGSTTGEYLQLVLTTSTDEDGNVVYSTDLSDALDELDYLTDEELASFKEQLEAANSSTESVNADDIQAIIDAAVAQNFVNQYLKEEKDDEDIYKEVDVDNKTQIYSGEDTYNDTLSAAQQIAVDKLIAEYNADDEDAPQTYTAYLALAANYVAADQFIADHLTGEDGEVYTEATIDNYADILGGLDDWNEKTEAEQAAINETLVNKYGGKTYEELLAAAQNYETADTFIADYLTGEDGAIYTEATADNYTDILAGEDDWNSKTDEEKAAINEKLLAAGSKTYEELLAAAYDYDAANKFISEHLTDSNGAIYSKVTADNYAAIIASEEYWNMLTDDEKAAVDEILKAEIGMTYEELLAQAIELKAEIDAAAKSPKTGDSTMLSTLMVMTLLSLGAMLLAARKREED